MESLFTNRLFGLRTLGISMILNIIYMILEVIFLLYIPALEN